MDAYRSVLITLRVFLAVVAGFYTSYRLFFPERPTPTFLRPVDEKILPYYTNPAFAKIMLVGCTLVAVFVASVTIYDYIHEVRKYGEVLQTPRLSMLAAMTFLGIFFLYYFILCVIAGGLWYYLASMTAVQAVLVFYERGQMKRYGLY